MARVDHNGQPWRQLGVLAKEAQRRRQFSRGALQQHATHGDLPEIIAAALQQVTQLGGGGGVVQVQQSRTLAPIPKEPAIARWGRRGSGPTGGGGWIQAPDALVEQRLKTGFSQQRQAQGIRAPAAGKPAAGLGCNGNDMAHQGQGNGAARIPGQ